MQSCSINRSTFTKNPCLIAEFDIEKTLCKDSCQYKIIFVEVILSISVYPPYTH